MSSHIVYSTSAMYPAYNCDKKVQLKYMIRVRVKKQAEKKEEK